eukprot:scaffold3568_cov49-Phaeocystis_antarctica.AAC.1
MCLFLCLSFTWGSLRLKVKRDGHQTPPLSPGRRGGATAQSALGWYRPSVGVPETSVPNLLKWPTAPRGRGKAAKPGLFPETEELVKLFAKRSSLRPPRVGTKVAKVRVVLCFTCARARRATKTEYFKEGNLAGEGAGEKPRERSRSPSLDSEVGSVWRASEGLESHARVVAQGRGQPRRVAQRSRQPRSVAQGGGQSRRWRVHAGRHASLGEGEGVHRRRVECRAGGGSLLRIKVELGLGVGFGGRVGVGFGFGLGLGLGLGLGFGAAACCGVSPIEART